MNKMAPQITSLRTAWARLRLTTKDIGVVTFATLALLVTLAWGWLQIGSSIFVLMVPVTVGFLLAIHLSVFRKILEHQERTAAEVHNNYRQIESALSLFSSLRISYPLPPLRGWAISPDFGVLLASVILQKQPRTILELGSGASTVVLGYCVRRMGRGRIVSLEHDEYFAEESRRNIANHKLEEVVTIVHAPLRTVYFDQDEFAWYDISKLPAMDAIDLLIIDGPPGPPGNLSRYPALPMLQRFLSNEAVIIFDDGQRSAEQDTVRRWLTEFPFLEAKYVELEKGALVLARSSVRIPPLGLSFPAEMDRSSPNPEAA
jgi:predicted O-methyltransferase YrrM